MKDILVAFFVALIIGSIINGVNEAESTGAEGTGGTGNITSDGSTGKAQQATVESNAVVEVDESSFASEVLAADRPVLVDFYSVTCGPCMKMAPVLAEIADEYKDSLKVVKIDVLRSPALARKYGVGPIPAFMVFKNGKKEDSRVGAMPKTALIAAVKPFMDETEEQVR